MAISTPNNGQSVFEKQVDIIEDNDVIDLQEVTEISKLSKDDAQAF